MVIFLEKGQGGGQEMLWAAVEGARPLAHNRWMTQRRPSCLFVLVFTKFVACETQHNISR